MPFHRIAEFVGHSDSMASPGECEGRWISIVCNVLTEEKLPCARITKETMRACGGCSGIGFRDPFPEDYVGLEGYPDLGSRLNSCRALIVGQALLCLSPLDAYAGSRSTFSTEETSPECSSSSSPFWCRLKYSSPCTLNDLRVSLERS